MDASIFYLFSGYFFTPDSQKQNVKDPIYVDRSTRCIHEDRICQTGITRYSNNNECKKLKNQDCPNTSNKKTSSRKHKNKTFNMKLKNAKVMINLIKSTVLKKESWKNQQTENSIKPRSFGKPGSDNEIWDLVFVLIKKLQKNKSVDSLQSDTKNQILRVQRFLRKQEQKS